MKKLFAFIFIFTLIFFSVCCSDDSYKEYENEIDSLKQEIENIKNDNNVLKGNNETLKKENEFLKEENQNLKNELEEFKNKDITITINPLNIDIIIPKDTIIDNQIIYSNLYAIDTANYKFFNYDLYYDDLYTNKYNGEALADNCTLYLKEDNLFDFSDLSIKKYYDLLDYYFDCDESYEYFKNQFDVESKLMSVNENLIFELIDGVEHVKITYHVYDKNNNPIFKQIIMPISSCVIIDFDGFNGSCILYEALYVLKQGESLNFKGFSDQVKYDSWIDLETLIIYKDIIDSANKSMTLVPYNDYGLYVSRIIDYINKYNPLDFVLNNTYTLNEVLSYNPTKIGDKYVLKYNDVIYNFAQQSKWDQNYLYVSKVSVEDVLFNLDYENAYEVLKILFNGDVFKDNGSIISIELTEDGYTFELQYLYPVG